MKYLVILDAGHGMDTPGKRTPLLEDGTIMREREFNKVVVQKIMVYLKDYDAEVYWVSESDQDVPLKERSDRANAKYQQMIGIHGASQVKCVFVSVHANASSETWDQANGVETFAHPHSSEGLKLADAIQKRLIQATRLRDRGVKTANFAVLRQAQMTAVLCECGFMNNKAEAKLLRQDDYRQHCANAISEGIIAYLNIPKKPQVPEPEIPIEGKLKKIKIKLNGVVKEVEAINLEGNNYIKIRDLQDSRISVRYDGMPIIEVIG